MDLWENRIVNGILKGGITDDAEDAVRRLACDVEIVADPARVSMDDLWPCVWALASVLERQFSGTIFINCDRSDALPAPASLGARCVFTNGSPHAALKIGVGAASPGLWGDTHGASISCGRFVASELKAHPIASFALAGYLGFAALATAVGIPPYRAGWTKSELALPFDPAIHRGVPAELTLIGLGQLGQAYLALLFFLATKKRSPRLVLVDRDRFETANRSTQLLLDECEVWRGVFKAQYLARVLRRVGWDVSAEVLELAWEWRCPDHHPRVALLGLDNFDARRMAIAAGYEWIIDAGVGTSFLTPRISWHSIPPDNDLGKQFFTTVARNKGVRVASSQLEKQLLDTPGACGWVRFNGVSASAPSLGLVAAAYAWVEVLRLPVDDQRVVEGRACLWSPLLPFSRTNLTGRCV